MLFKELLELSVFERVTGCPVAGSTTSGQEVRSPTD